MKRRPRSLLTTGIMVLLFATAVAAMASIGLLLSRNSLVIAGTEVEVLAARARALALGLRRLETGEWQLQLSQDLAGRFDPTYGRSFYAVRDRMGQAIISSMDLVPGEVPMVLPNSEAEEPATFRVRRGSMVLQGVSIAVVVGGTPLIVQVADNAAHPDRVADDLSANFFSRVSWVVLPVFMALAGVGFITLRLCMRPIKTLSRRAAELSGRDLGERLSEEETPREILPLVRAMNAALDRAERAYAAQRNFTAEAAHQMRTPLAVLRTHAELIQDRMTGEMLGADVAALERIGDQLLALAEIDAAAVGQPGEPVDLALLVGAAVDFLDLLAARQGVDLVLEVPSEPILIEAHEEPLYQAILNLLQNAIDHSPAGSTVWATAQAPGTVEIADQGPGVPEHQQLLVFRRFWRAQTDRTGRRRGAGLGLAIVQRVADLHSGTVSVEAGPRGGALFRLSLPIGRLTPERVTARS